MRSCPMLVLLAATFAPFMVSSVHAEESSRIRVLSYNIHHGEGTDGKLDLARIAKVIEAAKPDLVALQEVDVEAQRSGKVDQAQELSRLTRLHVAFGPSMDFQGANHCQPEENMPWTVFTPSEATQRALYSKSWGMSAA